MWPLNRPADASINLPPFHPTPQDTNLTTTDVGDTLELEMVRYQAKRLGREEQIQSDLFSVEGDVKPHLKESTNQRREDEREIGLD